MQQKNGRPFFMENFDRHQRGRFGLSVSGFFQSGGVGKQAGRGLQQVLKHPTFIG